jgi:hypothetical protein
MVQPIQNPQTETASIAGEAGPGPDLPGGAVEHLADQTLESDSAEETEAREASTLWDQPDTWPRLDATRLTRLALFGCLRYGRSGSEANMRKVGQLYELVTGELSVSDRQDLLVAVNGAVENGVASVNAFLPFLMTDPDIRVVSTAALNLASLMPLKDGDPLTGPKYLLSDVVALPNPELVRAGALVGLLLLGDRRVTRLLDRCWQSLTDEGRYHLAHADSGWTYASTVEFFLDWLEDTEARGDEAEFGLVAAAIANARTGARCPKVLDVERTFPVNAPGVESPIRTLAEWSFEAYGEQISGRLAALYFRESRPTILDTVMEVWGIPVPEPPVDLAVAAAILRAADHQGSLPEPVVLPAAPGAVGRSTLLAWGIFNPMGPTAQRVDAITLDSGEVLLVLVREHPFLPAYIAFDLLPAETAGAPLLQSVARLFAANPDDECCVVGSLPTYIRMLRDSPFDAEQTAGLFRAAIDTIADRGGELPDFREACQEVLGAWDDPWQQATADYKRAFSSVEGRALLREFRQLEQGDPIEKALADEAPARGAAVGDDTSGLFSLWFRLASASDFVQGIEIEMEKAWIGAQQFQQQYGNLQQVAGRSTIRPWPGTLGPASSTPLPNTCEGTAALTHADIAVREGS